MILHILLERLHRVAHPGSLEVQRVYHLPGLTHMHIVRIAVDEELKGGF